MKLHYPTFFFVELDNIARVGIETSDFVSSIVSPMHLLADSGMTICRI